jgi:hypothetical protein
LRSQSFPEGESQNFAYPALSANTRCSSSAADPMLPVECGAAEAKSLRMRFQTGTSRKKWASRAGG